MGGVALVDANGRFTADNCLFVRNSAGTTGGVVHVKAQGTFIGALLPLFCWG
jgi:predicted outer membrane repeat protein